MELHNNSRSFDILFSPSTVVIYQARPNVSFFIEGFKRQGFNLNNLYLISPKDEEFMGIKCYKNFDEIPIDSIDLLILSIRRELLLDNLKDILSKKKVNFIHIFTAGTGEFDDIGVQIEIDIRKLLQLYPNTRAIGPNCMGLYSPRGKTAYYSSFPVESGNVALVFQSGDLHSKMVKFGSRKYNLRFSLGVSIGNCVDIQISEILEYYNNDAQTDVICVYFEGLPSFTKEEGKRLFKTLKGISKPVLFMRGGRTKRGQKAVISHTGSLAANKRIWNAIYKQTNIIEVPSSLEELIDYTYMFSQYIARYKNNKKELVFPNDKHTLVVLWSGGFGILATDTLKELGLELPYFEGEILEKLKKIYPIKIGSLANPFDLPWVTSDKVFLEVCIAAIDNDIDFIIVEADAWKDLESERFKGYFSNLMGIKNHVESQNKVFVIILHEYPSESRAIFYEMLIKNNFIVYPTMESAAKSFLKLYEYGRKLNAKKGNN
jgi:acyl-CoA synthetase (NDP forming)